MKRLKLLSLLLITCIALSFPISTFAEDEKPSAGDARSPEAVALDLFGSKDASKDGKAKVEPILTPDANTVVEALVRRYEKIEGSFEINDKTRFYIATDSIPDDRILSTVRLIDAEFASEKIPTEKPLSIVYGNEKFAKENDIVIHQIVDEKQREEFNSDLGTSDRDQSYTLAVEDGGIRIDAIENEGLYYGLLTLLQLSGEKNNEDGKVVLDGCRIKDAPDSAERSIFLDCGRKYFSKEWIENFIKRSSFQRYNKLILHFSEAQGVRFDSEKFPWLTEGIDSISRSEMKEIAKIARTYNMEIIPSFDVPGHNRYIIEKYEKYLKKNPNFSFTYEGKTYDKTTKGFGSIANHYSYKGKTSKSNGIGIDVTDEYDVAFMNALIDDYADFFRKQGSKNFDIGGDEILGWNEFELGGKSFNYSNRWDALEHWDKYAVKTLGIKNGSAKDAFINYLNTVSGRLEKDGYKCRVFNDDIRPLSEDQHIDLKKSVDVVYWSGGNEAAKIHANRGHTVYNDISKWCYYVVADFGTGDYMKTKYKTVNSENIYKNWNPRSFSSKAGANKTVKEDKFGGGYFSIWCDLADYKSMETIWKETELRTWANSTKMWNPKINSEESGINAPIKYSDFKKFAQSMESFPGYNGKSGKESKLPAPSELKTGMNFFQKLISYL